VGEGGRDDKVWRRERYGPETDVGEMGLEDFRELGEEGVDVGTNVKGLNSVVGDFGLWVKKGVEVEGEEEEDGDKECDNE